MDNFLLHPRRQGGHLDDSPSSSVFDLPVQPTNPSPQPLATQGSSSDDPRTRVQTTDVPTPDSSPKITVISGGSGGNAICSAFDNASFVLPVSDDGGSSSEIIRVLGGPSIGAPHRCFSNGLPSWVTDSNHCKVISDPDLSV